MVGRVLLVMLAMAGFVASAEASCFNAGPPGPAGVHYILAFDTSRSITPAQLQIWKDQALRLVQCMQPGDSARVLEVNANSVQSVSLWSKELPAPRQGVSLSALVESKNGVARLKNELGGVITKLLAVQGEALDSDIFGLYDRLDPIPEKQSILVVWSDLLNTVGSPNLERVRIRKEEFPKLIAMLAQQHRWDHATLARTNVAFVLPSMGDARSRTPVNDFLGLKIFYTALVKSLGGSVLQFGADLTLQTTTTAAARTR